MALDRARPLHLALGRNGLAFAVVSLAWLRTLPADARAALAARHLARDEADFAAALPVAKRHIEWLAGRLALKAAVRAHQRHHGARAPDPAPAIRIRRIADGPRAGKPYIDGPAGIGLSHAGDFALAACGPGALGVDLEPHRTLTPYLARLLSLDEHPGDAGAPGAPGPGGATGRRAAGATGVPADVGAREDAAAPGPARARLHRMPLTLRWACKEAVLKYYGFGLRIGTGVREVELTGWHPDGRFTWRPGPELRRLLPAEGDGPRHCVAQEIDDYSLAMVWQ
ncbi:4-phosphopantetheinyl transferase family protein [Streptomyces sp. JJ36]|nr:4-phosphopantetheinyl transferase family protein [Streptomyces sp. JJ36]